MTIIELKAELARKMQAVRSYKLWQTAFQIAKDFGRKETRVSSDSTVDHHELNLTIGNHRFKVSISPFHYGHLQIFVDVNGERVFAGSEIENLDSHVAYASREIAAVCVFQVDKEFREFSDTKILVERYVSGDWLQSFEYGIFKAAIEAKNARKQKEVEAVKIERQLTEEENRFAVEFGVETGIRVRPRPIHSAR